MLRFVFTTPFDAVTKDEALRKIVSAFSLELNSFMYIERCAATQAPEVCVIRIAKAHVIPERTHFDMISLRKRKRRHQ